MLAAKASEPIKSLDKELQSLSVKQTHLKLKALYSVKNIILRPKPQLELCLNGVTIDLVEEAELLDITLDYQLSCSSHIDKVVVKMGRGMSVIK